MNTLHFCLVTTVFKVMAVHIQISNWFSVWSVQLYWWAEVDRVADLNFM